MTNLTIQKAREALCKATGVQSVEFLDHVSVQDALSALQSLQQDNERLVKALGFYASASRYQGANQRILPDDEWTDRDAVYRLDVTRDGGAIARQALGDS